MLLKATSKYLPLGSSFVLFLQTTATFVGGIELKYGALEAAFQFTAKHQLSLSNNSISSQSIIKMESYFSWTTALSVYQGWPLWQSVSERLGNNQ